MTDKTKIPHAIFYTSLLWLLLASVTLNYLTYQGFITLPPAKYEADVTPQEKLLSVFDKVETKGKSK